MLPEPTSLLRLTTARAVSRGANDTLAKAGPIACLG